MFGYVLKGWKAEHDNLDVVHLLAHVIIPYRTCLLGINLVGIVI